MALAYRAHFVFISRPLLNSRGENTSATFGFTGTLLRLIEAHNISHLAVVFDAPDGTAARDALYAEYKAHRPPPPDDLLRNLPWMKQVVRALGVPVLEESGAEADDVIGTLAVKASAEGHEVVIVSPDKDFRQLLRDGVSIFRPAHRGEEFDLMTEHAFEEAYGMKPIQFIDVLALMGDASDNVPGVPGIGEKTAIQLVQEYGSVEALIEAAPNLKGKRAREGMTHFADQARLSKALVTIKTDVPVALDWDAFKLGDHNLTDVRALFKTLEFNSHLARLEKIFAERAAPAPVTEAGLAPPTSLFDEQSPIRAWDPTQTHYQTVTSLDAIHALVAQLASVDVLSFDTETTAKDPMMASLVGVSLAWEKGKAAYIPTPLPDGTSTEAVLEALRPALQSESLKVGQNVKYDLTVLQRHGVDVTGPLFDTMVAHYLLQPEEEHNLDALARVWLGYKMIPIAQLIGSGKQQISMREVALVDVAPYACEDADVALQLYHVFKPELERVGASKLAEDLEFPLIRVLAEMEREGIRVDIPLLGEIGQHLTAESERLSAEIFEAAGKSFNINSPQQLGAVLFDDLGLKPLSKTGTGQASTNERDLEQLAVQHPVPGLVLDWRKLTKLKSTYVDALSEIVHPETGRVHTSFNQTITATGRLSSSNPNLQNIPVRTATGRELRRAFVAREGWEILSADYVQIELRILAAMSGDANLKQAFADGLDVHRAAAARVFGVPMDQVTREQRSKAKEVSYGIPYGISAFGLSQRMRIPAREAQHLIDQYAKAYPDVMRFITQLVDKARTMGFAETLLGRRRYVPALESRNRNERSAAERIAVNMPIQGTQADMIKRAMIRLHRRLHAEGLQAKVLLQVHDELVLEVPHAEVEAVKPIVIHEMVDALPLPGVPVEVDLGVGPTWLDAH